MGPDPTHSVVNVWDGSNEVKSLFIVNSSVIITSVGGNPTSTLQAVALYIADHIKARLTDPFD